MFCGFGFADDKGLSLCRSGYIFFCCVVVIKSNALQAGTGFDGPTGDWLGHLAFSAKTRECPVIASNYFWFNIICLSIATITIRFSFIAFSSRMVISDRLKEVFSFIPAAVLPALIAPIVFFHQGSVEFLMGKERFFVLAAATIVCFFTRSTLATVAFGLSALWFLTGGGA